MVAQLVVHRWLIAPVRRLPVELLSKIFLHLLDMLVEQPPNDVDISVALEYTIVNVCEAWRFAAYGTPHLWTHIECPPSKVLEPYFQHFLPLSGELPLSLYSCRRADMLAPFLEHMRPYAHRWGTLSLYGSPDDLTGLDPIRAPQLLSIEINFKSSYASNPYEPLNFIGDAPRLQRLLMNLPNVYQLISIPVAASLTWLELSFGAFHVYYVLPILEQSARMLQHFGFSVSCDLPEQRTHFTRSVGLPALTSLSLQGKTASLLTFISAPFLSEISVDGPPAVMPGCLLEFLQQTPLTGENLRALRLTGKKLAPKDEDVENLTQCFACMSDLKELSLSTPPPAPLVQALVCRDDAYPLLPNLRNALFECIAPTRRMHMEFLRSRDESRTILGTHVAALESFRLDTTGQSAYCSSKSISDDRYRGGAGE
ncbi:hypothetical protein HDZ31DRAFT_45982 [Schizophyllum fasciatum]